MSIDPARRAAYDVLHEIGAADAYANLALSEILRQRELDQRDAGFATDLVNGTLRHRGTLDAVLQECSSRPLEKIDPRILDVLRLGAFQLLINEVDPHAAVNTTVELAASVAGEGPRGFVNAIMRATSKHTLDEWLRKLIGTDTSDRALSIRTSHPEWIISAMRDALGKSGAPGLPDLLEIDNQPPPVTLVARPGRSTVAELVDAGGSPGQFSPFAVLAPRGRVGTIPAIREGRAGVQDEGSQLISRAFAHAPIEGRDRYWLDLCAGPGGKLALLAAIASERGAQITGIELHQHRAKLVEDQVRAAPGFAEVIVGDARERLVTFPQGADRVIVDAPCTGLGVIRRKPEIRWRRSPSDIPALTQLQLALLNSAIDQTRVGGVIAYVTCSPHLAETQLIVNRITRKRDDVEVEDARALFDGVPDLGEGPFVRLWPHIHGTDGMFFALLRRLG